MSAPTAPNERRKRHHVVLDHAKRPHGIVIIGMILFVMAWSAWTFVIW